MRGRRLLALVLALLCLGGCSWMDGSYVSVTPHQVLPEQTGEGTVRSVRNYTELRGALIGMIDSGTEKALFSLAEYPGEEVPDDLQRAVAYAQGIYPVGAYAVETIDYDFGTGLGASALSVDITYRRSREQIEGIRTVRWISGAKKGGGRSESAFRHSGAPDRGLSGDGFLRHDPGLRPAQSRPGHGSPRRQRPNLPRPGRDPGGGAELPLPHRPQ